MSNLKPLYVMGAGGFGREVAWLIEKINARTLTWNFKGFIDDDESLWGTEIGGYKVFGGCSYIQKQKEDLWISIAVGNSKVRKRCFQKIKALPNIHYATLINPDVAISGRVKIGEGTIICAGVIITIDITIGKYNIINLDCTVGHDAVLEDFVTLNPNVNISGAVRIGKCSEIGVGTQIIQGISIGSGVTIGAGSCVFRDVEDNVIALGNPARVMKRNTD